MKKIISFLVIALLSITSVLNTNGAWSRYTKENLIINWTKIASWYQIFVNGSWSTIYYEIREYINNSAISKFYKYNNWNITETKENEMIYNDLWNQNNFTVSKHYKLEKDEENMTTSVYVDWKLDWKFYPDFDDFYEISDNAFYYDYSTSDWEKNYKVFIFNDDNNTKVENKETITTENAKLDKTLNKVFEKVDEKWDENAQKIYKTLITKIDILLKNKMSEKNKNTLNYIKEKVEAKIK